MTAVVTMFFTTIFIARANLIDFVTEYSKGYVTAKLVSNVNDWSTKALTFNEKYSDYDSFVRIEKNAQDEITNITTNMLLINLFVSDVCGFVQSGLDEFCKLEDFSIPANALTGSMLLSQFGKSITIELLPIGNVDCQFRTTYQSVGINQTKHNLFLDLVVKIKMIMPLYSDDICLRSSMLVYENLIIGKVPSVYFSQNGENCIDLVP